MKTLQRALIITLNIKIDNKAIKQIHVCKSLGVIIDEHLTWNNNTNDICKKVTA